MAEDKDKKRKEIRERLKKSRESGGIDRSINRLILVRLAVIRPIETKTAVLKEQSK